MLAPAAFVGIIVFTVLLFGIFAWFAKDLPSPTQIKRVEGLSTVIYDRNGEVLYDVYADQNRIPIEINEIPKFCQQAVIAVEDKDFYKHEGFDYKGWLRQIKNIVIYRQLQGGSTLTQQLVKNVLLSSERTITRKIKEFILAVQIEKKYTKDQILQMYFNEAPYGGMLWGIETASQSYFGKHTRDLSEIECAVLAGLPQRPSLYSPLYGDGKSYLDRTKLVLRRSREDGYITKIQESGLITQLSNLKFVPVGGNFKAPHFIMWLKQMLTDKYGETLVEKGGLRVYTTLDYKLQEKAQNIVKEEIEKVKKLKVGNGAAVVLDAHDGAILSMVGSYDYNAKDTDGNVNVVLSERQPGSSGKPIVYASAFRKGYTPASILMDVKTDFPTPELKLPIYTPENYDGKFHGPMQIRYTLANSINIPAVKMVALLGVKEVMSLGYEMGLTTWEPLPENLKNVGLSLALGGREVRLLDLAAAYGVFASKGFNYEPYAIIKVTDSKGKILEEHKKTNPRRVLDEGITYLISHILSDDTSREMAFGRGSYLVIPNRAVAVKTGTTNEKRDNWTIGYTPSRVIGVWVGNNNNSPMNSAITSGVTGAAPIWNRLTKETLKDLPFEDFVKPENVFTAEVDALSGELPQNDAPKRTEFFIKGSEPLPSGTYRQKLRVSKKNGKLANAIEIAAGDSEEKEFYVFTEKDPVSLDGKNRWQEGINQWLNSQSDSKYKPPQETSDEQKDRIVVKITNLNDKQRLNDHDIEVSAEAISNNEIVKMEIRLDDSVKETANSSTISRKINIPDGKHKIKVVANDSRGNSDYKEITIGINENAD